MSQAQMFWSQVATAQATPAPCQARSIHTHTRARALLGHQQQRAAGAVFSHVRACVLCLPCMSLPALCSCSHMYLESRLPQLQPPGTGTHGSLPGLLGPSATLHPAAARTLGAASPRGPFGRVALPPCLSDRAKEVCGSLCIVGSRHAQPAVADFQNAVRQYNCLTQAACSRCSHPTLRTPCSRSFCGVTISLILALLGCCCACGLLQRRACRMLTLAAPPHSRCGCRG